MRLRSLSAAVVLIAGCSGKGGTTPQALPQSLEPSAHDPTGNYWCAIDDDTRLDFHCRIERAQTGLRLSKVTGNERLRGELVVNGDDLEFSGERYCVAEDCTQKLTGTFKPLGGGQYRGTFKDAPLFVK